MPRWEPITDGPWLMRILGGVQEVQVYSGDWLVEDFVLSCEQRIKKRFAELGIYFEVPEGLPELHNPPRRPRSIW